MRLPTDKPSKAASLKHRPLFTPLILPMLGFVAVLIAVIWLALAYQKTSTIVIAVWDDSATSKQSALFRIIGQVDVDATYTIGNSPSGDIAPSVSGDPMPARPLEAIPGMVDNIDNGNLLLLVNKSDFDAVVTALDIEYTKPVAAGTTLIITVPTLGKVSILRILPEGSSRQDF